MSKVRVIYVRKRILIKNLSNKWLIKNNGIERILDKSYELNDEYYNIIKTNLNNYLINLGESMKDNKLIHDFIKDFDINIKKNILEYVKELKKRPLSILHEGRYGTTMLCDNKVLKIQKLLHINDIKKYLKEIYICYYINKKFNLAPRIYNIEFKSLDKEERGVLIKEHEKIGDYLNDKNNYICGNYMMETVDYIFCDVFEPYKMSQIYKQKNKMVLENFVLGLRMCIGAIELLIDHDIHHNDVHDGNMGFTKEGNFKFIDFGLVIIINNIERYKNIMKRKKEYKFLNNGVNNEVADEVVMVKKYLLYRELRYLRDMYYYEDKEYLEEIYDDNKYSPVKNTLEGLKANIYVFGNHKKYLNQKVEIKKVANILNRMNED
jgi:hypothetical protein